MRIAGSSKSGPSELSSRLAQSFDFVVVPRRGRYVLVEQSLHMPAGEQPSPAAQQDSIPKPSWLPSSIARASPPRLLTFVSYSIFSAETPVQLISHGIHDIKHGDTLGRKLWGLKFLAL